MLIVMLITKVKFIVIVKTIALVLLIHSDLRLLIAG